MGEGLRELKKEILQQTPCRAQSQHGAGSHHPEIVTRAEIESWTLNRMHHLGTPMAFYFFKYLCSKYVFSSSTLVSPFANLKQAFPKPPPRTLIP